MKNLAILSALLLGLLTANGQTTTRYSYLIIRIPSVYNKSLDTVYSIINAESGNPYAHEVYDLMPFTTPPKGGYWYADNFYSHRTDSSKFFYNFFENTTEAMVFISQLGWELVSVANEIKSTMDTHLSRDLTLPYTIIESSPVYYFRKIISQ